MSLIFSRLAILSFAAAFRAVSGPTDAPKIILSTRYQVPATSFTKTFSVFPIMPPPSKKF
jgi:hypothetical protein